jgi:two-component system phosphate regulon sensor histidine kinase PhoR
MNKKKKIFWQLFLSFLLITLLSLMAVSWYASDSLRQFFLDQTTKDLKTRAMFLQRQIVGYLSPLDAAALDSFCKTSEIVSETRITVILPSGIVIGESHHVPQKMDNHATRPEIAKALEGTIGKSIRFSNTLQQRMIYTAVPIRIDDQIAAVLRVSIPAASFENEIRIIQIQIAAGGFVIALIAAGISLFYSRRISRPIEEMQRIADYFAKGDFNHRLNAPQSEEMAGLAQAMNEMADQLEKRIKTIIDQRNELEVVLSSMLEGVIAVDTEERIINMNQAAAKLFELHLEKFQGRSIQEVVRNLSLQNFIGNALSAKEPLKEDITIFQNHERILDVNSSPLIGANQEHIGTLIVFNDVTQLRRLEIMRRDFVANVSHEIKTPLTAIKGFVETLLQNDVERVEEAQRFLGIINKHVDRLSAIIEDLLSLSRIEQEDERKELLLETEKLINVFKAAVQICQPKAEEKKIDVEVNCERNLVATFDPTLLEQAVVNLLDNAIKYSEPESTVELQANATDSEITINVSDQGVGIAKRHQSRLFERFYRVDKARSRNMGGTGLGLAIVKHIAQAHGGHVSVDSELGKGSTFAIHLPIDA